MLVARRLVHAYPVFPPCVRVLCLGRGLCMRGVVACRTRRLLRICTRSRPHALASACTRVRMHSRMQPSVLLLVSHVAAYLFPCTRVPQSAGTIYSWRTTWSLSTLRLHALIHCRDAVFFMKKNALCAENYTREIHVLNGFSTNVLHRTYFERGVDDTLPKTQPWHRAHA